MQPPCSRDLGFRTLRTITARIGTYPRRSQTVNSTTGVSKTQQAFLQQPQIKQESSSSKTAYHQEEVTSNSTSKPKFNKCHRCGAESYPRQTCPAKDATCYRYVIGVATLSPSIFQTQLLQFWPEQNSHSLIMQNKMRALNILIHAGNSNIWEEVRNGQRMIEFKVDTGAKVTVISEKT